MLHGVGSSNVPTSKGIISEIELFRNETACITSSWDHSLACVDLNTGQVSQTL